MSTTSETTTDAAGKSPSPVFILLFDRMPAFDASGVASKIGALEPLKRAVSVELKAESDAGIYAMIEFDEHKIRLAGITAPLPASVTERTVPVSRFKPELTKPLLQHRAHVVCFYLGSNPDPTEQLIALQKVALAFLDQGLLGLLYPDAWNCMPREIVEKITLTMLRACMETEPLSFWIGFVKMLQDRGVWFCTKGQHLYGLPDLACRGELKEAQATYRMFGHLFLLLRQSGVMPKAGDTARVVEDEYVRFREVYEMHDWLNGPLGTLVVERTTEAEARSGGPDGSGHLIELRDKAIPVKNQDAEMVAAMSLGRDTLSHFWEVLERPQHGEDRFSLKVLLSDQQGTEHFWATQIERTNGQTFGTIDNDPNLVKNVRRGDRIPIPSDAIGDWMYFRDDRMVGNFTARVLLKSMPPAKAVKFRQMLSNFVPVKIHCACGQRFMFEVEAVAGRMPWAVKCPMCGRDDTDAANNILAQVLDASPVSAAALAASPGARIVATTSPASPPPTFSSSPPRGAPPPLTGSVSARTAKARTGYRSIFSGLPRWAMITLVAAVAIGKVLMRKHNEEVAHRPSPSMGMQNPYSVGNKVEVNWMMRGWQPATVISVTPAFVNVRFDDSRAIPPQTMVPTNEVRLRR